MSKQASQTVLILGGYGVFGGHLAARLGADGAFNVIVAGRSLEKAQTFCAQHGGTPAQIDLTNANLAAEIASLSPSIVVDAAGPFQAYRTDPYRVPKAAMACGAHYLDLSDDAEFTLGIAALNAGAEAAGVTLLSGVSSLPSLSSAIADTLTQGLTRVDLIESIILPDHHRKRGLSVIAAILEQAGKPMQILRDGHPATIPVWSDPRGFHLGSTSGAPLKRRANTIGAPDLHLFNNRYLARSVMTRAGLGSVPQHDGLWAMSYFVRWGWARTLAPLAKALQAASELLRPLGSSRGGMQVRVIGRDGQGKGILREWSLISENGAGPQIPAMPAFVMCNKIYSGNVPAGARPAVGEYTKDEAETALAPLDVATHLSETPRPTVFETALQSGLKRLPDPLRDLHDVLHAREWEGKADIGRGKGILSRIIGVFMGFPPAGENVPVEVSMIRRRGVETWQRTFAGRTFRSHLSLAGPEGSGRVYERFGIINMQLGLEVKDNQLHFPVVTGRMLGVPLPRFLLPRSDTKEFVGVDGRPWFDVNISMPIAGHVVSYKGWLRPVVSLPVPQHSLANS